MNSLEAQEINRLMAEQTAFENASQTQKEIFAKQLVSGIGQEIKDDIEKAKKPSLIKSLVNRIFNVCRH